MYLARATIVKTLANRTGRPSTNALKLMVRRSCAEAGVPIEHVHVAAWNDRVNITLFLQATSQTDADAMAHIVGARVCVDLDGWSSMA
jgi:hypothetical protein